MLFVRLHLVHEHLLVVAHDAARDAAVVILVLDALASARVHGFTGHDDLIVVIFIVLAIDETAAGSLLGLEGTVCVHYAPPPLLPSYRGQFRGERRRPTAAGW